LWRARQATSLVDFSAANSPKTSVSGETVLIGGTDPRREGIVLGGYPHALRH
jgi:hypothetical protein